MFNLKSDETVTENSDSSDQNEPLIANVSKKRKYIVEPLVFCQVLALIPNEVVSQFFVYKKMKEAVAARLHLNNSIILLDQKYNWTSDNSCGPEANASTPQHDFINQVQAANANFNMICFAVMTVPTIASTILLSAYSDKCGRKIAIITPLIAHVIHTLIYFLVILFDLSPWILMSGYFLLGISGNSHLMMAACYAYISDTTTKEQRQIRITILNLVHLTPKAAAIVAGTWVKKSGFLMPTAFTLTLYVLCVLYAVFLIPETVQKHGPVKFFTLNHLKKGMNTFLPNKHNDTSIRNLWILVAIIILYYWTIGVWSASALYELRDPLCWNAVVVGYYHTVNTVITSVGGFCSAYVLKRIATVEWTAIIAAWASAVSYIYLALCKNTFMVFFRKFSL